MKTLDEIKDQYAQGYGFEDWENYKENQSITEDEVDAIAIAYAEQFK